MPEDSKLADPETAAWELALGLLFQVDIGGTPIREAVDASEALLEVDPTVSERATQLAVETVGNLRKIDRVLRGFARNYTVPRIPAVERSLLRLAISQILDGEKPASTGTVRLAARLAEQYGGKDSSRFVNGVLRSIADSAAAGTMEAVIAPPPGPPTPSVAESGVPSQEKKEPPRFPGRRPGRREGQVSSKPPSGDRRPTSEDRPSSSGPGGSSRPAAGRDRPRSEPRPRPQKSAAPGESKAPDRRRSSGERAAPGRPPSDRRPGSSARPSSVRPGKPPSAGGSDRPSGRAVGPGGRPPRRPPGSSPGAGPRRTRPPGRGTPRGKKPPPPASNPQG